MTKISWTCPRCQLWSSIPADDHLRPEFCTYDGLTFAKGALREMAVCINERVTPEMIIQIESIPMTFRPSWLSDRQRMSKDLRSMKLQVKSGQEFPLICRRCGHDATSELTVKTSKVVGNTIVEFT